MFWNVAAQAFPKYSLDCAEEGQAKWDAQLQLVHAANSDID